MINRPKEIMRKTIQQYQAAAEEFGRILKAAGFRPLLIGSVKRSYGEELTHIPKDIDFVVLRDFPLQTLKLYKALWEYRDPASMYQKPFLISKNRIPEAHPVFEVGDAVEDKVEIWVEIFQPIYKGIPIDILVEMPQNRE